jgi:hypothetical protein
MQESAPSKTVSFTRGRGGNLNAQESWLTIMDQNSNVAWKSLEIICELVVFLNDEEILAGEGTENNWFFDPKPFNALL